MKLTKGRMMRVGWATPGFSPSQVLGADSFSYAIDGYQVSCSWLFCVALFMCTVCRRASGTRMDRRSLATCGRRET